MKVINKPMYESDRGDIFKTVKEAVEDDIMFYASMLIEEFNNDNNNKVDKDELLESLSSSDNFDIILNLAKAHNKLKEKIIYEGEAEEMVDELGE